MSIKYLTGFILASALFVAGCVNLEKTAYLSIGTTSVGVQAARAAFIDYANASHKITQAQYDEVSALYDKYQQAMEEAHKLVTAYKLNQSDPKTMEAALALSAQAASSVITLVERYLPEPERQKLKAKAR